jgi:hypothetical protein
MHLGWNWQYKRYFRGYYAVALTLIADLNLIFTKVEFTESETKYEISLVRVQQLCYP